MSKINKVVVKGVSYDIEDKNTASKALHYDSFNAIPTAEAVNISGKSVDGTNTLSMSIPVATTKSAGVMSAADKENLDNVPNIIKDAIAEEKTRAEAVEQTLANDIAEAPNLALRTLFVAAGAKYNDGGTDKTKTEPWGETVTHKAGHYYLNGLGDITEEDMVKIYNAGKLIKANYYNYKNLNIKTTLNVPFNGGEANGIDLSGAYAGSKVQIIGINRISVYDAIFYPSNLASAFSGCTSLRRIIPTLKLSFCSSANNYKNTFYNCSALEYVNLEVLKHSVSFEHSPSISQESILFLINKAAPTSAITITLHADAYARLKDDADIVAALAAQPLVTLVSA